MGFWSGLKNMARSACNAIKSAATSACNTIKSVAKAAWSKAKSFANSCLKKIKNAARLFWKNLKSMNSVTAAVVVGLGVLAFGVFRLVRAVIPGFGLVVKVISRLLVGRRVMEALSAGFIFRDAYEQDPAGREERMQSLAFDLLVLCISFLLFLFGI